MSSMQAQIIIQFNVKNEAPSQFSSVTMKLMLHVVPCTMYNVCPSMQLEP